MKSSSLPYWLTLMVVLAASYGFFRAWKKNQAAPPLSSHVAETVEAELLAGPKLTEFSLTNQRGEPFHSDQLAGQVWVASFFFVSCPSACVRLNQQLAVLQQAEEFSDVQFVSITCDPANDTPEVLTEYAKRFDADPERWAFCTGELDYVQRIGRDMMQVAVARQTHANHGVVIDRAGQVRGRFNLLQPAQRLRMHQVLRDCLAEDAPSAPGPVEQEKQAATTAQAGTQTP